MSRDLGKFSQVVGDADITAFMEDISAEIGSAAGGACPSPEPALCLSFSVSKVSKVTADAAGELGHRSALCT